MRKPLRFPAMILWGNGRGRVAQLCHSLAPACRLATEQFGRFSRLSGKLICAELTGPPDSFLLVK